MLLFVAAMNLLYVVLIFSSFASLQPLLAAAISLGYWRFSAGRLRAEPSYTILQCTLGLAHLKPERKPLRLADSPQI